MLSAFRNPCLKTQRKGKQGDEFSFLCADCTVKLARKYHEVGTSMPTRSPPDQREELHDDLHGEADRSDPAQQQSANDIWSWRWFLSRKLFYRHHVQPRVKLYVPQERTFPIPLKNIDVVHQTRTILHVLLASPMDHYRNVDEDPMLPRPWTCFTQFSTLNEKPRNWYTWSWRRLPKVQATSRSVHVWPKVWSNMTKSFHNEKRHWTTEKPNLDNAPKLSGILHIDPDDLQFKDTMESARTKLEVQMESAMPCKSRSTWRRRHVAEKVRESNQRSNETRNVSRQRQQQWWRSITCLRTPNNLARQLCGTPSRTCTWLAFFDPITLDPMIQVKYVNDHSLVTRRTNFSDCAEEKRVTQYQLTLKSKWRTLQTCWTFRNQNAPIFGFDTGGQELDNTFKSLRFLLKGICADLPSSVDCYGRDSSRRSWLKMDGRKHCPGYVYLCKSKWESCIRVRGRHLVGRGKSATCNPCGKDWWNKLIWRNPRIL